MNIILLITAILNAYSAYVTSRSNKELKKETKNLSIQSELFAGRGMKLQLEASKLGRAFDDHLKLKYGEDNLKINNHEE
jgi:hypothetical protein